MSQVSNLIQFFKEVRAEGMRVQWPNGRQTMLTTAAVLLFVAMTGAYLGLVDLVVSFLVEAMLK